jgi:hypothetical protein
MFVAPLRPESTVESTCGNVSDKTALTRLHTHCEQNLARCPLVLRPHYTSSVVMPSRIAYFVSSATLRMCSFSIN